MAVGSLDRLTFHDTLIELGFRPWRVFDTVEQGVRVHMADIERNAREGVKYLPVPGCLVPDADSSFSGEVLQGRFVFYSYSTNNHHAGMFIQECMKAAERRDKLRAAYRDYRRGI